MNLEALRLAYPGRTIEYHESIASTMVAAAGLPPGAVVVAGVLLGASRPRSAAPTAPAPETALPATTTGVSATTAS